jgi:hypothetical protein
VVKLQEAEWGAERRAERAVSAFGPIDGCRQSRGDLVPRGAGQHARHGVGEQPGHGIRVAGSDRGNQGIEIGEHPAAAPYGVIYTLQLIRACVKGADRV